MDFWYSGFAGPEGTHTTVTVNAGGVFMTEPTGWRANRQTRAFLVAFDVCGFSRELAPNTLLNHRQNFFKAVEETELFPEFHKKNAVKLHFLGDELRLAFHSGGGVEANQVRKFVYDVFANSERINNRMSVGYETYLKGAILVGEIFWRRWHGCDYLDGTIAFKAQEWMRYLDKNKVVINESFKISMENNSIPTRNLTQKEFGGEITYILSWP